MPLVAGVDSSTQSCKIVVCDAETGALVREARAAHPDGTEVHPHAWWTALTEASSGLLDDVAAVAVAGQQHGMVTVDEDGEVVRPALLWNDNRSAGAARDLILELGGPKAWAEAVGTVPPASMTITKLRWLADQEPEAAARVRSIMLPHDWLTWKLSGRTQPPPPTVATPPAPATGPPPRTPTGPTCSPTPSAARSTCLGSPHRQKRSAAPSRALLWPPAPATTWVPL